MALETFEARLKAKSTAAGAPLSSVRLKALAAKLNAKHPDLTEEADHDTQIDALYDTSDFKEMKTFDDYHRAKAAKEKKDKEAAAGGGDAASGNDDASNTNDDTPAWAKSLIESNKALAEEVNRIKSEKAQASIRDQAKKLLEGVPEIIWKRAALPENPEELEAWAAEIKSDYEATPEVQQPAQRHRPLVGTGEAGKKKASEEQVNAVVNKL